MLMGALPREPIAIPPPTMALVPLYWVKVPVPLTPTPSAAADKSNGEPEPSALPRV